MFVDSVQRVKKALTDQGIKYKYSERPDTVMFKPVGRRGEVQYNMSLQQIREVAFLALDAQCIDVRKIEFLDGTTVQHCPPSMVPMLMISRSPVEHTNTRQSEWI
jgi:hypothetical protein